MGNAWQRDRLLVPGCTVLVMGVAFLQHRFILGIGLTPRNFVLPGLVGATFGYLLMRILRLKRQLSQANRELAQAVERKDADLDEREEQLLQAHRMSSLGQIAASVAHDFNNVLACVRAGVSMVRTPRDDVERGRLLDSIIVSTESGAALSRQIVRFGRPREAQDGNGPILLDDTIDRAIPMLRLVLRAGVELRWRAGVEGVVVRASGGQIEQLLMNLVVNARDAIADKGHIEITTARGDAETDPHVVLTIRDTGCGMERGVLSKALEPFYSTKSPEGGTGLGLAVVKRIVDDLGASLRIVSEPGQGTSAVISLPIAERLSEVDTKLG